MKAIHRIRSVCFALIFACAFALHSGSSSHAAGDAEPPLQVQWSFNGPFGVFDLASAQRGLQVYLEVCSSCHALEHVAFRHLSGLGYSEAEIEGLAAGYDYPSINDEGENTTRTGLPKDKFPAPYQNSKAAQAANGGAIPPELSLITRARAQGANYVYSLLTGYNKDVPENITLADGQHYNPYMGGGVISMAQPLYNEGVEYSDGSPTTIDQQAKDVVQFLTWAADPHMVDRKRTGWKVILFLLILAGLFYASKRKLWRNLTH